MAESANGGHGIIVIGASAGGVEALSAVDHVVPVEEIGALLARLVDQRAPGEDAVDRGTMQFENAISAMEPGALAAPERPGTPSGYSCPECRGVLRELHDGPVLRFRCRVGHPYRTGGRAGSPSRRWSMRFHSSRRCRSIHSIRARIASDRRRDSSRMRCSSWRTGSSFVTRRCSGCGGIALR